MAPTNTSGSNAQAGGPPGPVALQSYRRTGRRIVKPRPPYLGKFPKPLSVLHATVPELRDIKLFDVEAYLNRAPAERHAEAARAFESGECGHEMPVPIEEFAIYRKAYAPVVDRYLGMVQTAERDRPL